MIYFSSNRREIAEYKIMSFFSYLFVILAVIGIGIYIFSSGTVEYHIYGIVADNNTAYGSAILMLYILKAAVSVLFLTKNKLWTIFALIDCWIGITLWTLMFILLLSHGTHYIQEQRFLSFEILLLIPYYNFIKKNMKQKKSNTENQQ